MTASHNCNRLKGLTVLATRPNPQNIDLCQMIADESGRPIAFPVIRIDWLNRETATFKLLVSADILIFISVNAVYGYQYWKNQSDHLKANAKIAAIGSQTKNALLKNGIAASIFPENGYNSEALLQSPQLTAEKVNGKFITIIRGLGGRDHLYNELRTRGAVVNYVEVYQRTCPAITAINFTIKEIDIISVTSNAGLENLLEMIGQHNHKALFELPLVVLSQRMASYAKQLGFKQDILITSGPGNQAIIDSIAVWRNSMYQQNRR